MMNSKKHVMKIILLSIVSLLFVSLVLLFFIHKKTLKEENHIPIAGADLVVSATSPIKNGSELLELPVSDSTQATDVIMTESETVESHLTKQKPSGWKVKNQKKLYYKNGKKVTGWRFIGKYRYYFNENGVLQTDKMISKNKYVNKKGRLVDKAEIYSHQKKGLKLLEKKCLSMKSTYSGTWCIYVKNLDTNKMLLINNQPLYPASLIKLFNMGYTYERVDQRKLQMTSTIESQVKSMITVSSNDSHNELLQTNGNGSISKGIDGLNNFCQRHGYLHTQSGGTLHPSYFSRVAKQNSYTTVKDCGHILEDIYRGVLVNETTDKHMLSLLKKQTRRSKIPAGIPANITVANKTGETDSVQHDAAIVFSPKADYIIVIMTKGDPSAVNHIQQVSKTVYEYFNK